jgi:hypothetical protein
VNVTKYVESASKFLPRPIGSQLVGVVSLLDPGQFTTTTAPKVLSVPVTPSPVNVTVILPQQYLPGNSGNVAATSGSGSQVTSSSNASSGVVVSATVVTERAPRTTTTSKFSGDDDDDDGIRGDLDYEEDSDGRRLGRQLQGINVMKIIEGVESLWKSYQPTTTEAALDSGNATACIIYYLIRIRIESSRCLLTALIIFCSFILQM